jgi:hypothetical protein
VGECLPDKTKGTLLGAVRRMLAQISRQYCKRVKVFRLDVEREYVEFFSICETRGILVEKRATEAQSGLVEKAGNTVIVRARAIRIAGNLEKLALALVEVAIYLLNRTPTDALAWKCPYELVRGVKPSLAHLSKIVARAYVLNKKLKRGAKLRERTLIGVLVGYEGTNFFPCMASNNDENHPYKRCDFYNRQIYGKDDDESLCFKTRSKRDV